MKPSFAWVLNFYHYCQTTKLCIFIKFTTQNLRQVGQGVHELWSKKTSRDYYFIYMFKNSLIMVCILENKHAFLSQIRVCECRSCILWTTWDGTSQICKSYISYLTKQGEAGHPGVWVREHDDRGWGSDVWDTGL